MGRYEVGFPGERIEKEFEKNLKKIPSHYQLNIQEAIYSLADNPRPAGKKYKPLKGEIIVRHFLATCRLRVGPYRILYDVDDAKKKVILLALRKRQESTYD